MSGRFPTFTDGLPVTQAALAFATERHAGQEREGDHAPFILHPLEVAKLLHGRGYGDEVVAAGVLHDVIEDAHVRYDELCERFGRQVADLVRDVSEPSTDSTWRERKARLRDAVSRAGVDAVAIYAADKIAKVRELRLRLAVAEEQPLDVERIGHYWASLEIAERRLGDHPFAIQLRFELEALEVLPPERPSSRTTEDRRTRPAMSS